MTRFEKAETIVGLLQKQNRRITFAESCTGGRAAAGIVDVPSASAVLDVSFVTYANEAKIRFLGVSPDTIASHGVVSEPVAGEMAKGCAKAADAAVGVGISGIAGPGGGTPTKPVGMVCFGFCVEGEVVTFTRQFGALGRSEVRDAAVDFVYDTLLTFLQK
ncbi:MAG: CinA family protein [Clostridia bacterium]|nr:CinA family protein [Clostridia bacterium]